MYLPSFVVCPGARYGRWIVLDTAWQDRNGHPFVPCQCNCGTQRHVEAWHLNSGRSQSCGCARKGAKHNRVKMKHGEARHNGRNTALYRLWSGIRQRCDNPNNPNYPRYGGRGITYDPRWHEYTVFAADIRTEIGDKPDATMSLDRIDNDGPYALGNVRWATDTEQVNNKRDTPMITYQGETLPLTLLARKIGISRAQLYRRIFMQGWTTDDAITLPTGTHKRYPLITYKGESRTLAAWARHLNMSYTMLSQRIKKLGWSIERAFTE